MGTPADPRLALLNGLRTRTSLPALFPRLGVRKIVEVGVYRGQNLRRFIAPSCVQLVAAVDCWTASGPEGTNNMNATQKMYDSHRASIERLAAATRRPRIVIYPMYSHLAAIQLLKDYGLRSFDLVYIDADHSEAGCTRDMYAYWSLVRTGGILAGHDYNAGAGPAGGVYGVVEAVDKFVAKMGLQGRFARTHGEDSPSWFVLKP